MLKYYFLSHFVKLLKLHKKGLKDIEDSKGYLSTFDLLAVFVRSDHPYARNFSYVLGSMTGGFDAQYRDMLMRLRRHAMRGIARKLQNRINLLRIDIQECLFLLNRKSQRKKTATHNYKDYQLFRRFQLVTGRANRFHINWSLLSKSPV